MAKVIKKSVKELVKTGEVLKKIAPKKLVGKGYKIKKKYRC